MTKRSFSNLTYSLVQISLSPSSTLAFIDFYFCIGWRRGREGSRWHGAEHLSLATRPSKSDTRASTYPPESLLQNNPTKHNAAKHPHSKHASITPSPTPPPFPRVLRRLHTFINSDGAHQTNRTPSVREYDEITFKTTM
ncbi:hypothetical protein BP00DRAFT_76090 [Aspergillus indologenus CBS 114.80]|uniref:Uncharacterized protein n=1 Tax=Aspergillus indologenus CBS 114.80 TaxID=1450541 RepID=A0A2V5IJQ0_9EURO|nr:hypothetical protein BP00DRAFT_76090 [Aspergillus indologenus CBS 114.80]